MIKIGIVKEEKNPPDTRVALIPSQAYQLMVQYDELLIKAAASEHRCFSDTEYREMAVPVKENVNDCEILVGVKEVPVEKLIEKKTYLFFSHTIKKQSHNKKLLQEILKKKIRLIDYECITDASGERVIAFGRFAGIVGAHNGLLAYGNRTGLFHFPRTHSFKDLNELFAFYKTIKLPAVKIVITGGGRVAKGALEVMFQLGIQRVTREAFVNKTFYEAVFVQLDSDELYVRKDGKQLPVEDFYKNPHEYECHFKPYYKTADIMLNAIFWNPAAPVFFSKEEMKNDSFNIKTIADISCDIDGAVPATTRATTIEQPVMGYNPHTEKEEDAYQPNVIDIMAVDNLPNELPRDASESFGEKMMTVVIPELLKPNSDMLERATIAINGNLTEKFFYLKDYVE
jgi:saccharopine dehydrogenase (NAD+, L-lysine forming)